MSESRTERPTNRLAGETSAYLRQHMRNPVDWYPWGPEAMERALREERPLLVSIGYSACHWCHVMEHESFEDPETAALMNRLFGDWTRRPFAAHKCVVPGLDRLRLQDVLIGLGPDLFDARTGQGWAIVYTPGRMRESSGLDLIALGDSWSHAATRARVDLPKRLGEIVDRLLGTSAPARPVLNPRSAAAFPGS